MGVFRDDVLAEKRVGAGVGRGGEADEEGVEVIEDLPPEVVDRAVALIDHDEVEEFGRDFGGVAHGERLAAALGGFGGVFILGRGVEFAALEDGIHALDRGDAHLRVGRDVRGIEPGDGVKLGELAVVVLRRVGEEFLLGLLAEVARVHEEEHAFDTGVLQQAVDGRDGGERLARAGGHLDEGARLGGAQRGVELRDGVDLAVAEPGGIERRKVAQAVAQGAAGGEPFAQGFRAVERKNLARARLRVALVGEAREDAGGFVEERQRLAGGLHPLQLRGGVFRGLVFDAGDVVTEGFLFRLDDADRLGIDKERVVGGTAVGEVFADGLALTFVEIDGVFVLHGPTRRAELRVNRISGDLFGGLVGHDDRKRKTLESWWRCERVT